MATTTDRYYVNARDNDSPARWMDHCLTCVPANQDSGCCGYWVTTTDSDALEQALDADDDVIAYEYLGERVG